VSTNRELDAPLLDEIRLAASRLNGLAVRTPLIRLNYPDSPCEIYLKLENLQPVGSFKIRALGNLLRSTDPAKLLDGVYTASTGNSGYTLAWLGRKLGIPVTVYVPDTAPQGKCELMRRMGARLKVLSYARWWGVVCDRHVAGEPGLFIDPVREPAAIAGNATIGIEILDDLPAVNTIVVPFGGGGVSCGIAAAVRALKPDTQVLAAESEVATPFSSALQAGHVVAVDYKPSFISGIGALSVLPEIWPLARRMLNGSVVVSLSAVADAIRILFECNRVVAEGAGATALAGALSVDAGGPVVCVITGGNIDRAHMIRILEGGIPEGT